MIDDKDIVNVTLTVEPKRKVYFDKTKIYGKNKEIFDYIVEYGMKTFDFNFEYSENITNLEIEKGMQEYIPQGGDTLYIKFLNDHTLEFVAKERNGGYEWICSCTPKHLDYDPGEVEAKWSLDIKGDGYEKFKRKWLEGHWIETNDRPLSKAEQDYADKKLAKSKEEFEKKAEKARKKTEDNKNLLTISNPHANLLGTSQFGYYDHDE